MAQESLCVAADVVSDGGQTLSNTMAWPR